MPDEIFLRSLNPPQKDYEKLRIINKIYSLFEKDKIQPQNNILKVILIKIHDFNLIKVQDFIYKILEEICKK